MAGKDVPLDGIAISGHPTCPGIAATSGVCSSTASGIHQADLPVFPVRVILQQLFQRFPGR